MALLARISSKCMQVRSGNVLELEGRLYQVTKHQHTHGHGRQLGNVQARAQAPHAGFFFHTADILTLCAAERSSAETAMHGLLDTVLLWLRQPWQNTRLASPLNL